MIALLLAAATILLVIGRREVAAVRAGLATRFRR